MVAILAFPNKNLLDTNYIEAQNILSNNSEFKGVSIHTHSLNESLEASTLWNIMSAPKALLEIAGVGFRPASSLNNSTLVLIDIQREYLAEGKVPLEGFNTCLAKCMHLSKFEIN